MGWRQYDVSQFGAAWVVWGREGNTMSPTLVLGGDNMMCSSSVLVGMGDGGQ